jgi:hypothetical protein
MFANIVILNFILIFTGGYIAYEKGIKKLEKLEEGEDKSGAVFALLGGIALVFVGFSIFHLL